MLTLSSQHLPWSVSCWCWWWWGTYGRCACCRVERGRLRKDSWDEKKQGMSKLCPQRFFLQNSCLDTKSNLPLSRGQRNQGYKEKEEHVTAEDCFRRHLQPDCPLIKKVTSMVVYSTQRCVPCVHQPSLSTNSGHWQQRNDDCAKSLQLWRQNVRTPQGPLSNIRPNIAFLLLPGLNNQNASSIRQPANLGDWKATDISAFFEIWEKNWCSKT